jgi:2-dehydropantoate 2-reductase
MKQATIGIVGTGAVGGFLGGKLALAGHKLIFISRGEALKKLQNDGLTLEDIEKTHSIKEAVFTDDASLLKDCQYILFAVKSYDTEEAVKQIKDYIADDALVITPQNGVSNDLVLAEHLGKKRVIPGLTKGGYTNPEPGLVKNTSFYQLIVGEYSGEKSDRLQQFVDLCKQAGIDTVLSQQIHVERWKKYVWNCTFNIIAAISGLSMDKILGDEALRDLSVATMKEIIVVANKEEIRINEEEIIKNYLVNNMGNFKPSTLQDVEKTNPTELDAFTGNLLVLAKKHDLETPINQTLYTLLHGITEVK